MSRRAIVSVAAVGFALFVGCSGEHGDTLDNGDDLPTTGDGGAKGDDASVSDSGMSADAGALDAALPDAGDAGGPTLMASKAALTVPRCGSDSFDVTWSASANLPEVTLEGLPAGVSYQVTSAEGVHASITVSATTVAAAAAPVDVTVRAGEVTSTLKLGIPAAFAPKIRVIDESLTPVQNAVVVLNSARDQPFMTDANGLATLSEVTPPYDLFVAPNGQAVEAIEYQGLTRCDPAFLPVGTLPHESARLSGTFTTDLSFDTGGRYYFGSKSLERGAIDGLSGVNSSAFGALQGLWPGDGNFSEPVSAVWVKPGPDYVGVGSAQVDAMFGQDVTNIAISFATTLPTRTHALAVTYGPFGAASVAAGLLAFDVPGGGRISSLPAGSTGTDLGTFVDATPAAGTTTLSTSVPTGDTLFAVRAGDERTVSALKIVPAAAGATTSVEFGATGTMQTVTWTGVASTDAVTFTWDAVPGASAIIVHFPNSVRAVLPGSATSYSNDNIRALAKPIDDSTCQGSWEFTAVLAEGYSPDVDADGNARYVPAFISDFANGSGRLFGLSEASVYTFTHYTCF